MKNIRCKIQIIMRKSAADIILFSERFPECGELLELRHDQIVAAFSAAEGTHMIMDLPASVQAHDDVVHLPVAEFHNLIVQQHAVGRDGKTEMLVMALLKLPAVGNQIFDDLPVHERLPAEKVHLEVPAVSGILNKEIQGFPTGLKTH